MIDKINKSYPFVDIIFGTHTLHKFPEDLYKVLQEKRNIRDILDIDGEVFEGLPIKRTSTVQANITIMYGCNNFCSYCIVPYVRGRERSRHPESIINEAKALASEGCKEITLLGQNVNSYLRSEKWQEQGKSWNGINSFATLLRAINEIDGIERIRFVSPHPKDFTDDVIEAIRDCDKVCKLVHLPLQSGSTKVLKIMNRKYTKEQYLSLVEKMKAKIPGVVFTTDIIVGFAGEEEEDFEDTLDVVEKVHFEQVYMFIYSRRVGTPGDKMENQVPDDVKHKRFDRLKKLVESQIAENNKKYVGTVQKVLVEGPSKNNANMYAGRTDSNKVVIFEGAPELKDKIINLKIVSEHMWYLKGEREEQ
jgi:tRNA-2-methylthio-N6-dimethylallyladenosine synthase